MSMLTKTAEGQPCMLRIPSVCNHNPETTVLCHLSSGYGGMGQKSEDWWGVYGCSDCHDWLDRRSPDPDWMVPADREDSILRALHRTWSYWMQSGVVKLS